MNFNKQKVVKITTSKSRSAYCEKSAKLLSTQESYYKARNYFFNFLFQEINKLRGEEYEENKI